MLATGKPVIVLLFNGSPLFHSLPLRQRARHLLCKLSRFYPRLVEMTLKKTSKSSSRLVGYTG